MKPLALAVLTLALVAGTADAKKKRTFCQGQDDIAHVRVKAAGRRVTVTWTQGGVPQSRTLP